MTRIACHLQRGQPMATIRARRQANGTLRYTAMVRLRKGKTLIHQEAKTFSHRGAAASWAKFREVELQKPGALDQAQQGETSLAALIRWYIDSFFEIAVRLMQPLPDCRLMKQAGTSLIRTRKVSSGRR